MDAALDYIALHWDGSFKILIILGAGNAVICTAMGANHSSQCRLCSLERHPCSPLLPTRVELELSQEGG